MTVLRETADPTEVLLVHAPYPGRLKFQGIPSSLLAAIGPFVVANPDRSVSYMDPRGPSESFYAQMRTLLASGRVRALCISTSTAAIGETAKIAAMAAREAPATLVVAGGPHEDAVDQKMATTLPGVHLSLAGEAECALQHLLETFLSADVDATTFAEQLTPGLLHSPGLSGRFTVACSTWPAALEFDRGPSRHQDPRPLVFPERYPKFDVFAAAATVPLMVSRGCPYGQCTFCSEANRDGTVIRTSDYGWVEDLAQRVPGAALYFQDSIFPGGNGSNSELLPLLQRLGREWGCQVYLPTLTEKRVAELAAHGCTYLYTGVESGAASVLEGINKAGVTRSVVLERIRWIERNGVRVGVSLMFGPMSVTGQLLETSDTLQATRHLAQAIAGTGVSVAGFYPNVQTVLPGTALARGLASSGFDLDFYSMPRAPVFDSLEDGGVGFNFLTVAEPSNQELAIAERITATASEIQTLAGRSW